MRVVVQTYAHSYEDANNPSHPSMVDFTRDEVPTYGKLQRWAEVQFESERNEGFQDAVQTFLLAYANEGHGLPKVSGRVFSTRRDLHTDCLVQHSLVSKVHQMSCFFRIWKTPYFYCRDPKNKITSLPLSAQARLRSIARSALHGLEHDVLKKLDDCLTQAGAPRDDERVAIWACLWQLMLMYRDLASANKGFIAQGTSYGAHAQARESQRASNHAVCLLMKGNSPRSCRIRPQDDGVVLPTPDNVLPLPIPHEEIPRAVVGLDAVIQVSVRGEEEQAPAPERQGHE